METQKSNVE